MNKKILTFLIIVIGLVGVVLWQVSGVDSTSYEARFARAMQLMEGLQSRAIPVAFTESEIDLLEGVYQDSLVRLPNVTNFRNTDKSKLVAQMVANGLGGTGMNGLSATGEKVITLALARTDDFKAGIDGVINGLDVPMNDDTRTLIKKLAQSINTLTNDVRLTTLYISWYETLRGGLCTTDDVNNDIYTVGTVSFKYNNRAPLKDSCGEDNITLKQSKCILGQYKDETNYTTTTACTNGCSNGACIRASQSGFVVTAADTATVGAPYSLNVKAINAGGQTDTGYAGTFFVIIAGDDDAIFPAGALKMSDGTGMKTVDGIKFSKEGIMTITVRSADGYEASKTVVVGGLTTCTGSLPANGIILMNGGTTPRTWTYDGSPTGPYQNCSFRCPTGTTYSNNTCSTAPGGNLLVSLSPATPLTGYAIGGSTVVSAVFDFKAENIQHTIKQLKFKVGSSEATSAIISIQLYDGTTTVGAPSVFIGNIATLDALNLAIPANTTKTIIVRLTLNYIGVGAGLSQSNVGLTLDEVSYENSMNGLVVTNPTDIVANAKYVYQSFPVLTQIAVNTSTKITNGTARDILKFSIAAPVTAITSNGISVKQIRFPISWVDGGGSSDTLEVESLKLSIDGTDITGTDVSIQDQGGVSVESTSGLTESDNYIIITWDSNKELTIGAGQVRTLALRGTMQGFNTGDQETSPADSFTIGFEPDYVHNDTKRYLVNHAPTDNIINLSATSDGSSGSVRYSFLWSDNSSSVHTGAINTSSSNDWANSYPIVSPFSNQVFTNANI